MESFFSSLKTERTGNKTYRTRDEARMDVFDYIERFYNSKRRHSTIGYLSPSGRRICLTACHPLASVRDDNCRPGHRGWPAHRRGLRCGCRRWPRCIPCLLPCHPLEHSEIK